MINAAINAVCAEHFDLRGMWSVAHGCIVGMWFECCIAGKLHLTVLHEVALEGVRGIVVNRIVDAIWRKLQIFEKCVVNAIATLARTHSWLQLKWETGNCCIIC